MYVVDDAERIDLYTDIIIISDMLKLIMTSTYLSDYFIKYWHAGERKEILTVQINNESVPCSNRKPSIAAFVPKSDAAFLCEAETIHSVFRQSSLV